MFHKIPFSEQERQVIGSYPDFFSGAEVPIYNTPVTLRRNMEALICEKHPYWMPSVCDIRNVNPPLYSDRLGRGSKAADSEDVFGRHWRYEPTVGGSIVESGHPLFEDVNEWRSKVKLPDIDTWDWAAAAQETEIDSRRPASAIFINGFWFERLISFMDFMNAAMALIDDDQTAAIKDLFAEMTDFGCRLIDKFCTYWPQLDMFEVHDDWGAQKAPFFSEEVANELFVPYMKQLTDCIHAHGRVARLHSCGHNEERIQCFIDGGFDLWEPQPMNDVEALYEQYGDRIVLGVFPRETDLAERSEAEQRAIARDFADRFCKPGKPAVLGITGVRRATPAFTDELYRCSRIKYLEQD